MRTTSWRQTQGTRHAVIPIVLASATDDDPRHPVGSLPELTALAGDHLTVTDLSAVYRDLLPDTTGRSNLLEPSCP